MPLLTSLINVLIGLQLLTLEVRADKFLVNYFLVSMYLDTLKAGGIVDVGKKLGQFLSI